MCSQQAAVAQPRHPRRLGVDAVEVGEHRVARGVEAVEIEAVKADLGRGVLDPQVVLPQPGDELRHFLVAPHPGREAGEGRLGGRQRRLAAYVAVDPRRVGPVGLHRHHVEALALDQLAGDAGAEAIELRGAVGGLAEQHQAARADALEERREVDPLEVVDRFRGLGEQPRDRAVRAGPGGRAEKRGPGGGRARPGRRRPVRGPSSLPYQRHEAHGAELPAVKTAVGQALDPHQRLAEEVLADRHDQAAADRELLEQRRWHPRAAGGHHDGIVGCVLRPAQAAIAVLDVHVVVAQAAAALSGERRQLRVSLDGIDLGSQARQHGRRVARARSHLEHAVVRLELQRLGHRRHHVGLRDGLLRFDRQCRVLVGKLFEAGGHEGLSRHGAHGLQHPRIADPTRRDLARHHALAGGEAIAHVAPSGPSCASSRSRSWLVTIPASRPASTTSRRWM